MANKQITPPATLPVSVEEAKVHLNETATDRDPYIGVLIAAAAGYCEQRTQRSLMQQTREETLDAFPEGGFIELPFPPVASVESVKYLDASGVEQVLSSASYTLDNSSDFAPAWLAIAAGRRWPSTYGTINAVRVRYICGYADPAAVPEPLKQWIFMQVGHWYANRESVSVGVTSSPHDYVDGLLDQFRVY